MPTHEYVANVDWKGGRAGRGRLEIPESGDSLEVAVPPEFNGPGGGTNPEELLTSSVAACYSITLGIIAENRKLPITSIRVQAVGQVEQNGASLVYTAIRVSPVVVMGAEATDAQIELARDMAMKADHYCIITNAIRDKVQVSVEPDIRRE